MEHHLLVEIEVLPVTGNKDDDRLIEKAIEIIQQSKLKHEVHALGTLIEGIIRRPFIHDRNQICSPYYARIGPASEVWPLIRKVHESCLRNGAGKVTTNVKLFENSQTDDADTIEGRKRSVKK
jgi:uncharacterized protein YqgV (UPF0045/DUF77 family)